MKYQAQLFFFGGEFISRRKFACMLMLSVALVLPTGGLGAEQVQSAAEAQSQALPAVEEVGPAQPPVVPENQFQVPGLATLLNAADTPRNYWSDKFVGFANDMDRFFGDPRYFQEANKSVLQINLTKVQEPGGGGNTVLDGQAKMDLPAAERRFSLLLESNPEKNISGDGSKVRPVIANEVVTSDNQSAALRYEKPPEESRWYFSADAGVKLHAPLEPFVRTRASYTLPMEEWRMKAAETVFWFNSIGAGETTQVDFERFISESWLFRATSTATWMNDTHNFDLRQDFSFYHTVNERTAVLYQASVIGVSQPQLEATEYVLLMLYRYRLHKSWVFVEISPQLHFAKDKNFDVSPMLMLRMEVLFDGSK